MLVGVAGNGIGAGKDTVGDYLVQNFKFTKLGFATTLKVSVAELFGLGKTEEEQLKMVNMLKLHPDVKITLTVGKKMIREMDMRQFLQRYGTESHRDVLWYDVWVDALFRKHYLETHEENEARFVICDVRFDNELKAIQEVDGHCIYVTRPGLPESDHASEQLDPQLCKHHVTNDQTFDTLYYQVDKIMEQILGVPSGAST